MNKASLEYEQTKIQIIANSARYEGEYVIFIALIQFLAWAWLAKQRPKLSCQKINSCQTIYGKERVKVRSTTLPLRYKKDQLK